MSMKELSIRRSCSTPTIYKITFSIEFFYKMKSYSYLFTFNFQLLTFFCVSASPVARLFRALRTLCRPVSGYHSNSSSQR